MLTSDMLKQELSYYNISVISRYKCCVLDASGKKLNINTKKLIKLIDRKILHNKKAFIEIWDNLSSDIACFDINYSSIEEQRKFIYFLKELYKFADLFDMLRKNKVLYTIKSCFDRDINSFSREIIENIQAYKISLDFTFDYIDTSRYINKLLKFSMLNNEEKNNIKLAQQGSYGVQGPYSNLDISMRERVFPWQEIDEEVRGRSKDIRNQQRYKLGLENYNNGKFGKGFVWREENKSPYLWSERKTESPYTPTAYSTMRP